MPNPHGFVFRVLNPDGQIFSRMCSGPLLTRSRPTTAKTRPVTPKGNIQRVQEVLLIGTKLGFHHIKGDRKSIKIR